MTIIVVTVSGPQGMSGICFLSFKKFLCAVFMISWQYIIIVCHISVNISEELYQINIV